MKRAVIASLLLVIGFVAGMTFVGSWSHGQPAAVPRELTSYRDVVKRVLPAVVSIETRAKNKFVAPNPQLFDDPRIPEEFRRPAPKDPDKLGFGSGFFVDPAGVVVTNFHVVEGAEIAIVQLNDGRKFTSKSIRSDRRTDVALILLDVKDEKFPVLEFGDSDAMEIGDRVLAVGAPFGLAGSVTQGIISAKGRNGLNLNMYEDFLQTDAAVNPGNSGGPLVNLEGKVVGVCAAIKSKSGGFQGVGLALTSNLAKNVVPSLQKTGSVKRGYVGAHIRELDAEVAVRLKINGVVLADVYDKSPAAKAGLKAGDIVTAVAGKAIKDGNVLQRVIAGLPIDQAFDADVVRDGKNVRVTIVVEEIPADYGVTSAVPAPRQTRPLPAATTLEALGVDVVKMTPELAEGFGFRADSTGVLITRVHDAGLASLSGLRRGTVISKIDDARIDAPAAASQALENANLAKGIVLQVATSQGGVSYVLVKSLR